MLQAVLESIATLGPIVFLLLIPVLIPIVTLGIGTVAERIKS